MKISISHGTETYVLTADFAQASCTLYLDGEPTPYQVADAGHDYDRAVQLVMSWAIGQVEETEEDQRWRWKHVDSMADHCNAIREALANEDEIEDRAEQILAALDEEKSEYSLTLPEEAKILAALITSQNDDLARKWARDIISAKPEIVEGDTDTDDRTNEEDGGIYATVERELHLSGEVIAKWTICARGFYVDSRSNPNYTIGWNVDADDSGGDCIPYYSALRDVLEHFGLIDEAEKIPEIEEPAGADECEESEAAFAVMVRNPYTQGMEDFAPRSFHPTSEDAEKAIAESYRKFRAANSDNAYGPEWAIGTRNEDGVWVAEDEQEG